MTRPPTTTWHVWVLPAHELPEGGEAPVLRLVAETDDPRVVGAIETAARDHGVMLERVK